MTPNNAKARPAGRPLLPAAFDTYFDQPEFELYDLAMDPWEFHNLAGKAEYTEVETRMKAALEAWRHETDDPTLDRAFHDQIKQKFADRNRHRKK